VFRPDHGHRMLDDLAARRGPIRAIAAILPPCVCRAELRGAIRAIEHIVDLA